MADSQNLKAFRQQERNRLIYARTPHANGHRWCDGGCGRIGSQMHERLNRYQTTTNEAARLTSYQAELCNWLCQLCHDKADSEEFEKTLWRASAKWHGRTSVLQALARHLANDPDATYHLPEEWE